MKRKYLYTHTTYSVPSGGDAIKTTFQQSKLTTESGNDINQ